MSNNQSIFLLEVKPFITEWSRKILSEIFGVETKVLIFGEEKPITKETLPEIYTSPIISITIESTRLGGNLILLAEQSNLIHLLNSRIEGSFLTNEDEQKIQNEVVRLIQGYINQLVLKFSAYFRREVKFSPSIQLRTLHDKEFEDDLSSYTRIDTNVIIEDDLVGRVITLLSPGVVQKYIENRDQLRKYIKQGNRMKNDRLSRISLVNSISRTMQGQGNIGMLLNLELPVAVELGQVRMMVKDILELEPGKVVELNKYSNEPVDIYLNHKKFAEGEVIFIDQNFGVRITALVSPDERLSPLM